MRARVIIDVVSLELGSPFPDKRCAAFVAVAMRKLADRIASGASEPKWYIRLKWWNKLQHWRLRRFNLIWKFEVTESGD